MLRNLETQLIGHGDVLRDFDLCPFGEMHWEGRAQDDNTGVLIYYG